MKNTESKYYTYLTNNDKTDLTMEDGTQITLNKNSRLTYSDKYGKEMRSVQLEGEAYFNVTKDSLKPFRITMGNSTITVLGTSFNLKNEIKSSSITAVSYTHLFESAKTMPQEEALDQALSLVNNVSKRKLLSGLENTLNRLDELEMCIRDSNTAERTQHSSIRPLHQKLRKQYTGRKRRYILYQRKAGNRLYI